MGWEGIEPSTNRLRVCCSTNWATNPHTINNSCLFIVPSAFFKGLYKYWFKLMSNILSWIFYILFCMHMRYTYILRCADNSLYCWITTDLERRISEHNTSPLGAKYTRNRRPTVLVRSQSFATRSDACKAEHTIKKMPKWTKEDFILG